MIGWRGVERLNGTKLPSLTRMIGRKGRWDRRICWSGWKAGSGGSFAFDEAEMKLGHC